MRKLYLFLSLFSGLIGFTQTHGIDSLKQRLKKTVEDTNRVIDLNELELRGSNLRLGQVINPFFFC